MNQALPSLHDSSLEITRTVPLKHFYMIMFDHLITREVFTPEEL